MKAIRLTSVFILFVGLALARDVAQAKGPKNVKAAAAPASLAAPTNLTCPVNAGVIEADWDDVTGAKKYSVDVVATYDTGVLGDPTDDTTLDFDFGTSDRTDGAPINQSDLDILLSDLDFDFGSGLISPYDVQIRVKALNAGKGQKERQNHLFSAFCDAV
jgi:hypothetical protein